MFVLTLGSAYAGNGITDFAGKSYDNQEIVPASAGTVSVEGGTGGLRSAAKELRNGVTDFSCRTNDSL